MVINSEFGQPQGYFSADAPCFRDFILFGRKVFPGGTFWESLKYITEVVPSHIDLACELIGLSLLVILYLSSGLKFW